MGISWEDILEDPVEIKPCGVYKVHLGAWEVLRMQMLIVQGIWNGILKKAYNVQSRNTFSPDQKAVSVCNGKATQLLPTEGNSKSEPDNRAAHKFTDIQIINYQHKQHQVD